MIPYFHDAWYPAAESVEVGHSLLARTLLDQKVVLFRQEGGEVAALLDRCAHRFAPLSQGQLCGDRVACPYHGMQYAADGMCVHIPGQDRIPPQAKVRSFPVIERYGLVFVWMGDPAQAEEFRLVSIPEYDAPGWSVSRSDAKFGCSWRIILENLIDPAHTSFVHSRTIGNSAGEDVPLQSRMVTDDTIECGRWINGAPAVPIMQRFSSLRGDVDRWQYYYVTLPCTGWVDFGVLPAGTARSAAEQANAPYRVKSYAFLAPIGPHVTHYFSFQLRNFAPEDAAAACCRASRPARSWAASPSSHGRVQQAVSRNIRRGSRLARSRAESRAKSS